jgi:hypothetical protein
MMFDRWFAKRCMEASAGYQDHPIQTNVNTDSAPTATIFLASSVPTTLSSFIQSHFENITRVLTSPSSTSTSISSPASAPGRPPFARKAKETSSG